jgi:hypothetical protein
MHLLFGHGCPSKESNMPGYHPRESRHYENLTSKVNKYQVIVAIFIEKGGRTDDARALC